MLMIRSIRDFYAFEEHVKTCRAHRGLPMIDAWYKIPVFYFSNATSVIGDRAPVWAPYGSSELDFELEIAAIVGQEVSDLPADDSAMECLAGFTIYNDFSARDLQRTEMAVGLGPSKGKDFANALGPSIVPFSQLRDRYIDGRLELSMQAFINDRMVSNANAGSMYWTWPQLLSHASRDTRLMPGDAIGSGTVGTGCILELTPEVTGGWLQPGDTIRLTVERLGTLENPIVARPGDK
jgi:fumarylacetoacetate (FAA) hydrolase